MNKNEDSVESENILSMGLQKTYPDSNVNSRYNNRLQLFISDSFI